jgi:hypothetical protein
MWILSFPTGLDPALPGFGKFSVVNHNMLERNDARFVDIIHTCGGFLAQEDQIGHADFYPNNGRRSQPTCDQFDDIFCECSHSKAYEYFASSITKDLYKSYPCKSWDAFKEKKCIKQKPV